MCGICGVYQYSSGESASEQLLRDMLAVIRHRGPDDEGMYSDHNLALGMRRLSIIELDGGKQPTFNEDGRVVVVFNGEVYNYRELTGLASGPDSGAKEARISPTNLRTISPRGALVGAGPPIADGEPATWTVQPRLH
jgi:asparagine synthetase B (glutamine-hydrolysing)